MSKESRISRGIIIVGICVVAVFVSGVTVACSRDTNKKETTQVEKTISPEEAAKAHAIKVGTREWGQAYDDLLPQQQAVISKATYIKCGSTDKSGNVKVDVVDSHNEIDHQVPGVGSLDSTVVILKATFTEGTTSLTTTKPVHVYNVNGTWKSSVDQGTFDAESKGQCK